MMTPRIVMMIRDFAAATGGVTAIEYGLIAGVIGLVTATAMTGIGSVLSTNYFAILAALFA